MNAQIRPIQTVNSPKAPPLRFAFGEAFEAYVSALEAVQDLPAEEVAKQAAGALKTLVAQRDWLPERCCEPNGATYQRHVLYADPDCRFTILSLVWRPDQGTPVHGHTAWGAVGVYRGTPSVAVYDYRDTELREKCETQCSPGDVCFVVPGTDEPHRVFNDSNEVAITIHTYGRDLVEDPASINILL